MSAKENNIKQSLLILFVPFLLLTNVAYTQVESGSVDQAFNSWLQILRQEGLDKGISPDTIDLAFSDIKAPIPRIVENDRNQPEVVQTYTGYLNARVSEWKINKGQELIVEHNEMMTEVTDQYKVQKQFITSIWGMETNFGTYEIPEPLFNALATLAYDNRRASFFRAQFMSALEMLDSGFPSYEQMKSSWAGAMGQSQFIPDSYLKYAVDFDNDGKRDIWENEGDVFASIANYLKEKGWQADQTWGRPVQLPVNGESSLQANQAEGVSPIQSCRRYRNLGVWRDLQEWQSLGVRREDGSDLPTRSILAALVMADSGDDQGYLVYANFCSIMSYNPSIKYALSIGLLSDHFE